MDIGMYPAFGPASLSRISPRRVLLPCVMLACLAFLAGCGWNGDETPRDIFRAEEAIRNRDVSDAEMYYQRYLRKNPDGKDRWPVWLQLLKIARDIRQDRLTAREYLEIMLLEFENDPERRRAIQVNLAGLASEMRNFERAVSLWEVLAEDPDTPPEIKAGVYRELSHAYLRRLEFTPATDVLRLCLSLPVQSEVHNDCLYDLAEAQMLTEDLEAAETTLRDLLGKADITPQRRVLAVFMLGDVLEQLNRHADAIALFESIRESYPNEKVVEMRLAQLKGRKGK